MPTRKFLTYLFFPSILFSQGTNLDKKDSALVQSKSSTPFRLKSKFSFPKEFNKFKDYRTKWTRLTNYDFSGLHWNQFVVIYVNKEPETYVKNYIEFGRQYLDNEDEEEFEAKFYKYSKGTSFVKEHYLAENGEPSSALSSTFMTKREKGYDPEYGDWEYGQITANGQITMKGNSKNKTVYQACIKCHSNMKERDYIFANHSLLRLKE